MTVDVGVWLEAAAGCDVPPECYAAVRQGEAKGPVPPMYCVPHKVSCVGRLGMGSGPAVVDLFQRVGSISLASLDPGTLVEAAFNWPGHAEVRLRAAVVAVGQGTEVPVLAQLPPVLGTLDQEEAAGRAGSRPFEVAAPEPSPEASGDELLLPAADECETPLHMPSVPPVGARPMVAEKSEKIYAPISLKDCNQIIPNLYLGGVQSVGDPQSLVQQGIRAVCCCCRELEFPSNDFNKDLQYYRVDVEDMAREPIELFFPEATGFIHSWVSREQPVLVHCRAGVSRSASVVIAYLIAFQGYSLHDAFFLVRSHRAVVTPNIGFMEKLIDFEEIKRGSQPTIEIFKYEGWYTSPERAAVPDLQPD